MCLFFDIIVYQREMKKSNLFLFGVFLFMPLTVSAAVSCSRANLTRCLDSVCAINVSSNPAARCQYCGTASAGEPPATGMRSVSVGASAKYNISDKDLKKAPKDPSKRYAWAAQQCLKKVSGCTTDDVADVYDSLIEQSCKAAGVAAEMKELAAAASEKPSKSVCKSGVDACVLSDKHCMADFSNCISDVDFNNHFAACGVDATGCDEYMADIRQDLVASRDALVKNVDALIDSIVVAYQNARDKLFVNIKNQCDDNSARDACIERVCATNMINKCAPGFESERSMATQMCAFYDIACDTLK